jgi:hypothetical protein
MNRSFETVVLYHPKVFEVHQKGSENRYEQFQLFWVNLSDWDNLLSGKSLLSADQQSDKLLEFLLITKKNFAPEI